MLLYHLTNALEEQHGLCRALSYILQTLSAEPAFGVKLSNPIKAHIPAKWNPGGTAADFLIHVSYYMLPTYKCG
jgi:hypothetical protein